MAIKHAIHFDRQAECSRKRESVLDAHRLYTNKLRAERGRHQMEEQNYRKHTRIDPLFHRVGVPLVLINFIGSIVYLISRFSWFAALMVISSVALFIVFLKLRNYSTKLQDRIVRIEENFRHYTLTGAPLDPKLTISQIIALRFASDEEFPSLSKRAVQENLSMDEIKKAVQSWRADTFRV